MTPAQLAVYTDDIMGEASGTHPNSLNRIPVQIGPEESLVADSGFGNRNTTPTELATVHLDLKLMPALNDIYAKEERLIVIVGSGMNGVPGDNK